MFPQWLCGALWYKLMVHLVWQSIGSYGHEACYCATDKCYACRVVSKAEHQVIGSAGLKWNAGSHAGWQADTQVDNAG